jgi:F-type H+-transporting ATPase subunit delta|tara:strand:- start:2442 stop:2978 length:537 start_codon:yes stop_codon:yes gene_type:complete
MAEISTVARPYSTGIFSLAKETKKLAEWSEILHLMATVINNKDMLAFVSDPKIVDEEKEKLLIDLMGKGLSKEGINLVKLLIENKRLGIVATISKMFDELKDIDQGTIEADLVFASKPSKEEVDELIKSLEKKFKKKIEANVKVDEDIIGGTIIHVGDTVIDASVKGQLSSLAYNLKA